MPDYKQEVRNLQNKKRTILGPAAVGQQDNRNIMNPPPPMPGNQAPDVVREKYVKILQHDFTGQDWIVRNKERRVSINRNYKLVTGATRDLSKAEKASRRDEVEARRVLSLSASSRLIEHIAERDKRKGEWDELDKEDIAAELMSKTPEDFEFSSDEDFLASFGERMRLLGDAQLLSHELAQGEAPEGYDAGELSAQLTRLDRIREAYENRIQIISSPYYLSIRDEDLTVPTMERLREIKEGRIEADETLKSYAEAVVGWKGAKEELFGEDRAEKPEFYADRVVDRVISKAGMKLISSNLNKKGAESSTKEWIYDDLQKNRKLSTKQIEKTFDQMVSVLEEEERKAGNKEKGAPRNLEYQAQHAQLSRTAAHVRAMKEAFRKGEVSKNSVLLFLDRKLMFDRGILKDTYHKVEEQRDDRSKEEKKEDQKLYTEQLAGHLARFINAGKKVIAKYQNANDPEEERRIEEENSQKLKENPKLSKSSLKDPEKAQKLYFYNEAHEGAKDRYSTGKLVPAGKEAIQNSLDKANPDFIHVVGSKHSKDVLSRAYISVNPKSKAKSVKALVDTAIHMELVEDLYFKVSTTAEELRADDIVIYFGRNLKAETVKSFLDRFYENCEKDKVEFAEGENTVVAGRSYKPGVSMASEPYMTEQMNKAFKEGTDDLSDHDRSEDLYRKKRISASYNFSYNGFILDMLFKGAVLANIELKKKKDEDLDITDPQAMKLTKKYFKELCMLNGLNVKDIVESDIAGIFKEKAKEKKVSGKKETEKKETGKKETGKKEKGKKEKPVKAHEDQNELIRESEKEQLIPKKKKQAEEGMPEVYRTGQKVLEGSDTEEKGPGRTKDSAEMLEIKKNIQALQAFLSSSMPPFAKTVKEEEKYRKKLGGTNLAINLMYNRLIKSLDAWLDKKDTLLDTSPERTEMLTQLREQSMREERLFAQSLKTYRDRMIGSDLAKKGVAHSWARMLRHQRADKIDIDADPKCMTMVGDHTSTVMKIKKNGKTWFFKEEENILQGRDAEIADQIAGKVKTLSGETLAGFKKAMAVEEPKNIALRALKPVFDAMRSGKKAFTQVKKEKGPLAEFVKKIPADQQESFRDFYIQFFRAWNSQKISARAGIDQGRNLSRRNVATTRLAGILGIEEIVAESRTAEVKYQGRQIDGNLMDEAEGVNAIEAAAEKVNGYSERAEDQLLMLQIYDLLCGQVDRHHGNYMVKTKDGKIDSIKCIDNDLAFGKLDFKTVSKGINRLRPLTPEAIRALPVGFRKKILALNKEFMHLVLRDLLEPDELESLADRLTGLQAAIREEERRLAEEAAAAPTKQERREILDPELNKLNYLKSLKTGDSRTDKTSVFIDYLLHEGEINSRIRIRKDQLRK